MFGRISEESPPCPGQGFSLLHLRPLRLGWEAASPVCQASALVEEDTRGRDAVRETDPELLLRRAGWWRAAGGDSWRPGLAALLAVPSGSRGSTQRQTQSRVWKSRCTAEAPVLEEQSPRVCSNRNVRQGP